jgi:hypothetical protein
VQTLPAVGAPKRLENLRPQQWLLIEVGVQALRPLLEQFARRDRTAQVDERIGR